MIDKTTLLVDGSNNFIRNYVVFPSSTKNGIPFGGVVGFLRSLTHFVKVARPNRIVIAFDAEGGSVRRRKLCKEYKHNRKPKRLNREFEIDENDERANREWQFDRLIEYLENLPVHIVRVDNIEADDVLAYLNYYFDKDRKVIVSSDKDFHQLLDNSTVIYKPSKKEFYTQRDCVFEYNIHPVNMTLARAIIGDTSDNVKGVPGIGLKTLLKMVPCFKSSYEISLEGLMNICRDDEACKKIIAAEDIIKNNFEIMNLRSPIISAYSITKIKEAIEERKVINSTALKGKIIRDGIDIGFNFIENFMPISLTEKTRNVKHRPTIQ